MGVHHATTSAMAKVLVVLGLVLVLGGGDRAGRRRVSRTVLGEGRRDRRVGARARLCACLPVDSPGAADGAGRPRLARPGLSDGVGLRPRYSDEASAILTNQVRPNWSWHMPNSSPHICFSSGIETVPLEDSFSQ